MPNHINNKKSRRKFNLVMYTNYHIINLEMTHHPMALIPISSLTGYASNFFFQSNFYPFNYHFPFSDFSYQFDLFA
ncbi:hypothetical protein AQUCO_00700093v1 [Aquilegia coerulea]|uniref:Uncharacterized protein n=1 Tax=Aquilegia coerulea TaxID=218851 RepID=A0A2G5EIN3_AQUCA|nr:hypothetical protein AQUCO_00700093v1 [Aquilegia coerulea]